MNNKIKILPFILFVFLAGILFILDFSSFSYKLFFSQIMASVFFLVLFFYIIKIKKIQYDLNIFLFFVLFLFLQFFAFIISEYKILAFFTLSKRITFLSSFIVVLIYAGYRKDNKVILFLPKFISLCGILAALYGIFQYAGWDFFNLYKTWHKGYYRIFSFLGNSNFLASYLNISFCFILSWIIISKSKMKKVILAFCLLTVIFCLILTFSKSGYFIFILTLVLYAVLFYLKNYTLKTKMLCVFLGTLIIFLTGILFFYIFLKQNPQFQNMLLRKTARGYIWEGSLDIIKNSSLLLGSGFNSFMINFPDFRPEAVLDFHPVCAAYIKHSHNFVLENLIETGFFGVLILVSFIFIFFYKSVKAIYSRKNVLEFKSSLFLISAVVSFTGLLAMNLFNVGLYYPVEGIMFWVLLGYMYLFIPKKNILNFSIPVKGIFIVLFLLFFIIVFLPCPSEFMFSEKKMHNPKPIFICDKSLCMENIHKKEWDEAFGCYLKQDGKKILCPNINNKAGVLYYLGKYQEAEILYSEYLDICQIDDIVIYNLALTELRLGNIRKSVDLIYPLLIRPGNFKNQSKYFIYKLLK